MQRSKTYRAAEATFDKNELYAPLTALASALLGLVTSAVIVGVVKTHVAVAGEVLSAREAVDVRQSPRGSR